MAQEFFLRFIERPDLHRPDPDKGRFRTYLLASVKNFLSNWRERSGRLKRGGGRRIFSLDAVRAEKRYELDDGRRDDPEREFERVWALTLLEKVMACLADEYRGTPEREKLFENIKDGLTDPGAVPSYREVGEGLGLNEGAIKVAVHRLKKRFGEVLRQEIAETLAHPGDEAVEEELRQMFQALR